MTERYKPGMTRSRFALGLTQAVAGWVDAHPTPDKKCMFFVGNNDEQLSFTPREYHGELSTKSDFGQKRITFYMEMARNGGVALTEIIKGYDQVAEQLKGLKGLPLERDPE